MRISYSDEEEYSGQFALWQSNCERSIKGKVGQRELRELEAALLAMPEKRLIHGSLVDEEGGVCAIACYARHKGVNLATFDPDEDSDQAGIAAGMPRMVAWKVVELNDFTLDSVYDPTRLSRFRPMTPEERYTAVLKWVREQIKL